MARPVDRSKPGMTMFLGQLFAVIWICGSVAYLANDLYVADLVAYSIISVTLNES